MSGTSIDAKGSAAKAEQTRMGAVHKMIDRAVHAIEIVLALALIAAVCLNFVNVGGRYLFNYSLIGADEIAVFLMVGMTFFGTVAVTWHERHLRMDMLVRSFPQRVQTMVKVLERILLTVLAGLLVTVSSNYVIKMFALGSKSSNAEIPLWIPHASLALGFALTVLVALWQLARQIGKRDVFQTPTATAGEDR
jgi:TRAP-type C4-dicarboxylate transport system permease small subunit